MQAGKFLVPVLTPDYTCRTQTGLRPRDTVLMAAGSGAEPEVDTKLGTYITRLIMSPMSVNRLTEDSRNAIVGRVTDASFQHV